mgnify:CR=1 FL=1
MQVGSEYKSGDIVDIGKSGSLCSARTIQTAQTLQTAHSRAGCSSEASEGNELVFSWKWLFCVVRHYRSIQLNQLRLPASQVRFFWECPFTFFDRQCFPYLQQSSL